MEEKQGRAQCARHSSERVPGERGLSWCPRENEATDYDRVKEVRQKRYNLTEDGYRERFRTCSPEEGENPSMSIVRLKIYLERWMKLAEAP
ncbi:hypothetical protein RRG08_025281 [Elysia crispata]|uniref:Uncharacterized protein n=1 Tax=Elysia crispata TaxID=231223 RepID=A0AAE1AG98_9GAST|nr:hypothetical protein RRG08_025281 [Elysia crispata]